MPKFQVNDTVRIKKSVNVFAHVSDDDIDAMDWQLNKTPLTIFYVDESDNTVKAGTSANWFWFRNKELKLVK